MKIFSINRLEAACYEMAGVVQEWLEFFAWQDLSHFGLAYSLISGIQVRS